MSSGSTFAQEDVHDGDRLPEELVTASRDALVQERDELLRQVRKLEEDLARYRAQAELLGKTLLSATSYAEWVREGARHDAELALRKARQRADRTLGGIERERERTEHELVRLRALTDETRARLSAFLTTALEELSAGVDGADSDDPTSRAGLEETLGVLTSALRENPESSSWPMRSAETEIPQP